LTCAAYDSNKLLYFPTIIIITVVMVKCCN